MFFPPESAHAKLALYATHDTTIILMLIAMGIFDKHWPPYAANLTFEVWGGGGGVSVAVLYGGKPMVLPCAGGATHCSLPAFEAFMHKLMGR